MYVPAALRGWVGEILVEEHALSACSVKDSRSRFWSHRRGENLLRDQARFRTRVVLIDFIGLPASEKNSSASR